MVFCVVFVVVSELFQTIVQGGVLKYTSQFLLQVQTMPTCVGSSPADLWQKGRLAAQEHFGVLVLL